MRCGKVNRGIVRSKKLRYKQEWRTESGCSEDLSIVTVYRSRTIISDLVFFGVLEKFSDVIACEDAGLR